MSAGSDCAARHGLGNVTFRQEDLRQVRLDTHGEFDVVHCLGLLYHLDVPDKSEEEIAQRLELLEGKRT